MRPLDEAEDLLAAEQALGLTTPRVSARLEALARREPARAMQTELWRIRFAELGGLLEERSPSPKLRARILSELAGDQGAAQEPRVGVLRTLFFWRSATATLAAALLLAGISYNQLSGRLRAKEGDLADARAATEALSQAAVAMRTMGYLRGEQPGLWLVRFDPSAGEYRVRAVETVAMPELSVYELWLLPERGASGEAPRSMGLLETADGAESRLRLPNQMAVAPGRGLAVSVEPPGGSPTGLPTGPVVYTGAVFEI